MRRKTAFQPDLSALEPRAVLSRLALEAGWPRSPAPETTWPGALEAPGNSYLSQAAWTSLHQDDVARAARGNARVVFLGDSIFYLLGDPHRKLRSDILQPVGTDSWVAHFSGMRAANFGIPGDRTQNLLWRVEHGELAGRPKVAVILIGINNLLNGDTPQDTAAGVGAVVAAVRAESPRTQVVLVGLTPVSPALGAPIRRAADAVNAGISGLAGDHVRFVDVSEALLAPDGTVVPGLVYPGSAHPTPEGDRRLTAALEPVVRQALADAWGRGG